MTEQQWLEQLEAEKNARPIAVGSEEDLARGREIRQAREARGMSALELERRTKLKVRLLEAYGCSQRNYRKLIVIVQAEFHPVLNLDTPDLGGKLRSSRIAKGLSQEELSEASGVTISTLKQIETKTGYRTTGATLAKLCKVLGIDCRRFVL